MADSYAGAVWTSSPCRAPMIVPTRLFPFSELLARPVAMLTPIVVPDPTTMAALRASAVRAARPVLS